ncbi:hypothetical protein NW762_013433 [Fusarium torreyae]|uniref:Major facilitator superfamily (MFS) profile domain-containing protein n=1 Tax=Fusarium torreyae TaxID=1237075 RepID=A0A9W8V7T7_9HYPO|nr:hypothetical protein NW762_013433 [Fusarium torreyae]
MDSFKLKSATAERHEEGDAHHLEDVTPLDLDDPHRAALDHASDPTKVPSMATILAIVCLAMSFIAPMSCGYILITAIIVPIQTDLGDPNNTITWLIGGWSVASAVSFPVAGALSDIFGRRWVIMLGQAISMIGSIVGATAQTVNTIVAGSTLLGFSTGLIYVSYAGIPELLPNKWRGIGLASTELAIGIPWGVANVLFASLLVLHTSLGWRWCYYIGLITAALSLVGTFAFYFPPSRPQHDLDRTRWDQFKAIDFVGLALYAGGLTTLLVGLTWAGQPEHPWRSSSVIGPVVIGAATLVVCFIYEFTVPSQPLFPMEIFQQFREFTILLAIAFSAGMVFYPMLALLPQGSLYLFTSDQIEIGLMALPSGCVQIAFGVIGPALVGKIKRLKLQLIVTLVMQTTFTAALAGAVRNKTAWVALQSLAVGPFILAILICYLMVGLNMPLRHLGLATGLVGTFRSMGGSVGNAIFNTILQEVVRTDLGPKITAAALQEGFDPAGLGALIPATYTAILGVPGAFAAVPGISPAVETAAIQAFRNVYGDAFSMVFYVTIPFNVIVVILALFVKDPSKYLTNHTAVQMEKKAGPGNRHTADSSAE